MKTTFQLKRVIKTAVKVSVLFMLSISLFLINCFAVANLTLDDLQINTMFNITGYNYFARYINYNGTMTYQFMNGRYQESSIDGTMVMGRDTYGTWSPGSDNYVNSIVNYEFYIPVNAKGMESSHFQLLVGSSSQIGYNEIDRYTIDVVSGGNVYKVDYSISDGMYNTDKYKCSLANCYIEIENIDFIRVLVYSDYNFNSNASTLYVGMVGMDIGGSDAQLSAISGGISNLQTTINNINTSVSNINNSVSIVEGAITNIENSFSSVEESVDNIENNTNTIISQNEYIIYGTEETGLALQSFIGTAEEVRQHMQQLKTGLDKLNKPNVNNYEFDINTASPDLNFNSKGITDTLGKVLANSTIQTMLVTVFGLATVSYVLFGKRT